MLEYATVKPTAKEDEGVAGRVLVVDDEEVVQDVLETLLSRSGYEVTSAGSAETASDLLAMEQFDAVLLDLMLPGRGGMVLGMNASCGFWSAPPMT